MTRPDPRHVLLCSLLSVVALVAHPAPAQAQDAADFYRRNCYSCHTIGGGRLAGPDLKGLTERQPDRDWLIKWIVDPATLRDSGDPYAEKLKREARGAIMPKIMGMTPELANMLISLIEAESALPESHFAGLSFSDAPFTPAEISRGWDLYRGTRLLANGGPACIACHAVSGSGGLGGGRLGPDLTLAYERLQGRAALGAWLLSPPTQTMQTQYRNHALQSDEIIALVALLEDRAKAGGSADLAGRLTFVLLGLGGAVLGLISLDFIWQRRFRGVRTPLVHGPRSENHHDH